MSRRPILLWTRAGVQVAAVIPAYNAGGHIAEVLRNAPVVLTSIIVVDDASEDETAALVESLAEDDPRIQLVRHARNQGVGAAMVTGYRRALETGADIVVKIDADGQMPMWLIPKLVEPLVDGTADYTKGNRFRDFASLRRMPALRRFGNVALSFMAKVATGYWNCFDPTNGFVAIRADVLSQLPLPRIDRGYYFETSMLANLYLLSAVVKEIPMAAQYDGEPSSLSIPRVIRQFPRRLLASFARRIVLKNFVYDFNLESFHLALGVPLLSTGLAYGSYKWFWYSSHALGAPTGTVVLPAVLVLLGVQLLLSAMNLDLQAVPREPINSGAIEGRATVHHASDTQDGDAPSDQRN